MKTAEIIKQKDAEISILKAEIAELKRLIYGSKKETFIPSTPPDELSLFDEILGKHLPSEEPDKETITYERKKPNHPGRTKLPDNLPVEEIVIEPQEDTEGMTKIGQEVTETLKYTPASLTIKRIIRPKYIKDDGSSIIVAPLPSRPIEKGIPEACLLAYIFVCKFVDHLPFYRQIQRFARDYQWILHKSTINSWFISVCTLLKPLYLLLREKLLESGSIQVDESPLKVLDPSKPKTTHQGYQWVYHSPELKLVLFDYRKGRGMDGPKELLSEYEGWLQCDGYSVYDAIGKQPGISLAGCMAHARRKFYEAKQSDRQRSDIALSFFQKIYAHERKIKQSTNQERKAYRDEHVRPLLVSLREWVQEQSIEVLPQSPMGKAMIYLQNQCIRMTKYILPIGTKVISFARNGKA